MPSSPTLLMIQTLQDFQDFECIGSSHGWIALIDKESNDPFLFNPFSNTQIHLPKKQTLKSFHQIQITTGCFGLSPKSIANSPATITKLVLCGNPSHDENYAVIVMYTCWTYTKLAICRQGDKEWTNLDCELETYYDVVCHDETKTAFALGPGPRVEVWDLSGKTVSKKKMINILEDSCPRKLEQAHKKYPSDLYTSQWYLALSSLGQIFLAIRYIGEFVRYDGEVVYEGDTLTDYASEPLVCPYKTVAFDVLKLDEDWKKWIEVESLDDYAMFLGGNQSMMMVCSKENLGFKRNSIYFTDDYWDRMDEDYCYGGHDNGVYSMEDGSIEPVLDSQEDRIVPPPFWIVN